MAVVVWFEEGGSDLSWILDLDGVPFAHGGAW